MKATILSRCMLCVAVVASVQALPVAAADAASNCGSPVESASKLRIALVVGFEGPWESDIGKVLVEIRRSGLTDIEKKNRVYQQILGKLIDYRHEVLPHTRGLTSRLDQQLRAQLAKRLGDRFELVAVASTTRDRREEEFTRDGSLTAAMLARPDVLGIVRISEPRVQLRRPVSLTPFRHHEVSALIRIDVTVHEFHGGTILARDTVFAVDSPRFGDLDLSGSAIVNSAREEAMDKAAETILEITESGVHGLDRRDWKPQDLRGVLAVAADHF